LAKKGTGLRGSRARSPFCQAPSALISSRRQIFSPTRASFLALTGFNKKEEEQTQPPRRERTVKRGMRVGGVTVAVALGVALPGAVAGADPIQAAIDRGVNYLRQIQVFHDGEAHVGANALVGLTLLECGVKGDDPAVQRVTDLVRSASPSLTHTYSLALSI